jgi:hypothetical protein
MNPEPSIPTAKIRTGVDASYGCALMKFHSTQLWMKRPRFV